jgi:lipopolysaccharide biosynthesis regulator YciM
MHWLLIALGLAVVAAVLAYRLRRRREEAQAWLKGVRSMISDDPDAAIEALSDAARLGTSEAVETYLALGQLLRRTGDLTRAIRLHRNMLHRPGLEPSRRAEVERELADDYRRAGMLSEAAETYQALAGRGDAAAAQGLRDVLVEQGRLEEALAEHRARCPEDRRLLAHLLAAAARAGRPRGAAAGTAPGEPGPERGGAAALAAAREAASADPTCADALLARAEAEAAAGEAEGAARSVEEALRQAPRTALLAWPALAALPVDRGLAVVDGALARGGDASRLRVLRGRLLARAGRNGDAVAELRRAMEADADGEATFALREVLRDAAAPTPDELPARHDLMVAALLRQVRPLRCVRCGAGAASRAWRCPRCGAFDAYP